MAYFDETQSKFLDNLIKGASNEELFKLRENSREPAAQPTVEISGAADFLPLEGYEKTKNPVTRQFVDNNNIAISQMKKSNSDLLTNRDKSIEQLDKYKEMITQNGKDADAAIANYKEPATDLISQAILSLGPAILGGLTGESGNIAQAKASTESRSIYDKTQKGLSGAARERLKSRLQSLKEKNDSLKELAGFAQKDVHNIENNVNQNNRSILDKISSASKEAASLEGEPSREANKIKAAAIARDLKREEKNDQLMTIYGQARTPDDAKKIKEAAVQKEKFDSALNEMIKLREKHGGGNITNREDVERGKQLSKDLLLAYKNIASLGVLSASDEKILNSIIPPDPLEYTNPVAAIQNQDPTLNRMKSFRNDTQKDFQTRLKNYVKDYDQSIQLSDVDREALSWARQNPKDPRASKILQKLGVE